MQTKKKGVHPKVYPDMGDILFRMLLFFFFFFILLLLFFYFYFYFYFFAYHFLGVIFLSKIY